MLLRKKIILSNILLVALPIVLIVTVWAGFVNLRDGNLRPIRRTGEREDFLTDAINVLYTFEGEISDMKWDIGERPGETGTEILLVPEPERMEELLSLGYHLEIESENGSVFSNMDDADREVLGDTEISPDGAVIWRGGKLVIQDTFEISGQTLLLTAVYSPQRADRGVQSSLLPVFMVSPYYLIVLIAVSAVLITGASMLVTRWLSRSVLVPLEQLKTGTDRIAQGDLDYRISYPEKDEFGDVCGAFDRMSGQLQEAERKQERFEEQRHELLRGISHDLRSPLTSIKGYASGLKDGIADTEEKRRRYCEAIITRSDDLERLTDSLSLLVRLDGNGMLHPETVCLDEYIRQLLEEKESWLAVQNIEVEYLTDSPDALVNLDIREMQRVFTNLFENTARYRVRDRSRVEIAVHGQKDRVEILFSDDGPGVGGEHLEHLFDSFYRADEARTNPEKGSGLGLAVAKRILEGQNGSITAYSENGLCITMVLPRAKGKKDHEENTDCGR